MESLFTEIPTAGRIVAAIGVSVTLYVSVSLLRKWLAGRRARLRRGRYLSAVQTTESEGVKEDEREDEEDRGEVQFFYEPPSASPMDQQTSADDDDTGDTAIARALAPEVAPTAPPRTVDFHGPARAAAVVTPGRDGRAQFRMACCALPSAASGEGGPSAKAQAALAAGSSASLQERKPLVSVDARAGTDELVVNVEAAADAAPPAAPRFPDLQLAKDLAKVSGDAYDPPPPGQGYQTRDIYGLPAITMYDKEVLKQQFAGVLQVKLVRANNLKRMGFTAPPSAYAVVSVGAGSFRSRTFARSMNPAWKETQTLFITDPDIDALVVRVFHDDYSPRNEDLGLAAIGLSSLAPLKGEKKKFTLPLRGPAGDRACVTVKCRLLLFTEVDPEEIPEVKRRLAPAKAKPKAVKAADSNDDGDSNKLGALTHLEPLAFVDASDTDTQVWVHWDKSQRTLVCAFRGTETDKIKDIITDMRVLPCKFTDLKGKATENVQIHRGFMNAYSSVRRTLKDMLAAITSIRDGDGRPWRVVLTGHSLGAALASLAAFELAMFKSVFGVESVSLYTYGSPRVGNAAFAGALERTVPDAWRMTNPFDIVTSIPPSWLAYQHAGNPVRLRPTGEVWYCLCGTQHAPQPPGVSADSGASSGEVVPRDQLTVSLGPRVQLSDKAVRDVRVLVAALSFRGVSEHACTLYASRLGLALRELREHILRQQQQQEQQQREQQQ